jgi:hypothetical protein
VGFACASDVLTVLSPERGERQLNKILETLTFLNSDGDLPLIGLVEAQAPSLPRASTVVLVTPPPHHTVDLAVDYLIMRNLRPVIVHVDAQLVWRRPGRRRNHLPAETARRAGDVVYHAKMTLKKRWKNKTTTPEGRGFQAFPLSILAACPASADGLLCSSSTACGMTGRITRRFSNAAFGLPGRLTISVARGCRHGAREHGVGGDFQAFLAHGFGQTGRARWMTARVASGVTSRGAKPVPPVVRIRSTPP